MAQPQRGFEAKTGTCHYDTSHASVYLINDDFEAWQSWFSSGWDTIKPLALVRADTNQGEGNGSGVELNFYAVQIVGSSLKGGVFNGRIDPAADQNIELKGYDNVNSELKGTIFSPARQLGKFAKWANESLGHSMHNNKDASEQIISDTKKAFDSSKKEGK